MAKKVYVFYSKNDPFQGYIKFTGYVDPLEPADGSTYAERLEQLLVKYPDHGLKLLPADTPVPDPEAVKFNWQTLEFLPLDPADKTPKMLEEEAKAQRDQDIIDNLPSWSQVQTTISNISDLADAKVFLEKLTRVVYWLAKNAAD